MSMPLPTYDEEQQRRIAHLVQRVWCGLELPSDIWDRDEYGRRVGNRTVEGERRYLHAMLCQGMHAARTNLLGEALRALDLVDVWTAAGRPTFGEFKLWFPRALQQRHPSFL